jgi:multidrug efflux pump subunit AcrA (membrane-fusion protein)
VGIARKWVFPILRLVLFVAVAVALVKIAFFAETGRADPAHATGKIVEPRVAVAIGTIQNDVTLSGTVSAATPVAIKATLDGTVRALFVKPGQKVSAGTPILSLRSEATGESGSTGVQTKTVVAPVAGKLTGFSALVGQSFAVGDDVGTVAPRTFIVSGTLAPEQQYRLLNKPKDALVTVTGGPAPFICTKLRIASAAGDGASGGSDESGGPTVRCRVPKDVVVFAGLSANLVLAAGVAENVLTVPTTAVEGSAFTGNVYLVAANGSTKVRKVTLGLSDGVNVEIKDGLKKGDMILQFVPGAEAASESNGDVYEPDGEMCSENVDGDVTCESK